MTPESPRPLEEASRRLRAREQASKPPSPRKPRKPRVRAPKPPADPEDASDDTLDDDSETVRVPAGPEPGLSAGDRRWVQETVARIKARARGTLKLDSSVSSELEPFETRENFFLNVSEQIPHTVSAQAASEQRPSEQTE